MVVSMHFRHYDAVHLQCLLLFESQKQAKFNHHKKELEALIKLQHKISNIESDVKDLIQMRK